LALALTEDVVVDLAVAVDSIVDVDVDAVRAAIGTSVKRKVNL
jgi:hypothetical protein